MANSISVLIPILVGLSILGAVCGPVTMSTNGFGDASWMYFIDPVDPMNDGYPGAPKPAFRDYTGVKALDSALAALVAYFSALLDGDIAPQYNMYAYWAFWQFMPLSVLVVLEGMRSGNRHRLVSWTSTMLLVAQFVSWQFLIPLWVILYLITSPIARQSIAAPMSSLRVDAWSVAILPLTVFLTFMLPTIAMYLPASVIGPKAHYVSIAFWQPFPLWHYLIHTSLTYLACTFFGPIDGSKQGTADPSAYISLINGIYGMVFVAGLVGQLPILLFTLAPRSVLSLVTGPFPLLMPYATSTVTLSSVFLPWSPFDPPTVDASTIGSGDLAPLAVFFLHYDMHIGCGALLIWAVYLHRNAVKTTSLGKLLVKTAAWFSVGGFSAAIAALLWERDLYVLGESGGKKQL